ncbi:DUF2452 domain-containing protein [Halobacteriovorax sp. GB3]|uniref:DUF2452 domain-containing protein n=1 Tax=Halobacteriovorax sp. GB3 TaxID=2719615 RepID=UPI00235E918F|nr:DUF2452 domain-containing protein [Halobacteriovorax sp. GB3]MDD0853307.1 DUF2452 domain-containing protein [Halobacteriovorax sp. GB3]
MAKRKEIKLNEIDLEALKRNASSIPGLIDYAHEKGGAVATPNNEDQIKSRARMAMMEQTQRKLDQIYEQMKPLIDQMNEIKKRRHISNIVYDAEIRFKPVIGTTYYLYEKKSEGAILSMVSPKEWGKSTPFKEFLGAVKLLADHTFELAE